MHWISEQLVDGGIRERKFNLAGIPGIVWTPTPTPTSAAPAVPCPLILMGHPGGLDVMYPRLAARARNAAASGFGTATIELPGSGVRPPLTTVDHARTNLRQAIMAGERPSDEVVDQLVLPLVDQAVPEWRAVLDYVLALPEIDGPVGISGGITAMGIRLSWTEPRIAAAGLFAGSYIPPTIIEEARRVTIPVHVLLQWDDHGNDRQLALDLFDALGSEEKTLQANMGGHTGVPPHAAEDAGRFFVRHLG